MRIAYIDNLRAILMMLGVVLHSAAVFSPEKNFRISYQTTSVFLQWLDNGIHVFRMPLFFMISGFFALMLLERYGTRKFLRNRAMRIAIPLVVTALTLNVLQEHLLALYYGNAANSAAQVGFYTRSGIGHLWFLVNLLCYCLTLAAFSPVVVRKVALPARAAGRIGFYGTALLFPFLSIAVLAAGTLGVPVYSGIVVLGMPYLLLYYFGFFILGAVLYRATPWVTFIESDLRLLALAFTTACACFLATSRLGFDANSSFFKVLDEYLRVLVVLFLCLLIWSAFARLLQRSNRWMNYLSDASYTMYLVHHVLIIALVIGINKMHIVAPPLLLFGCLVVVVFFLSLLIHFVFIGRFFTLKLAFNGR